MPVGKISVCAVMQDISADLPRNVAECADFLLRVADSEGVIGIDEIDDASSGIDGGIQLCCGQPIAGARIVNGDFAYLCAGLPGKLHWPLPTGVGRYEIGPRSAIGS